MIRSYSNAKIYRNFSIGKVLSIISVIASIISIIACVCVNYPNFVYDQLFFYSFSVVVPIYPLAVTVAKSSARKLQNENKLNNDISNIIFAIIMTLFPYIWAILWLILFGGQALKYFSMCGNMLPAHIFVYIADGFLIHNCKLIKREWKDNPPEFYKEQQAKKEQKKYEQTVKHNTEQYKKLIERCGVKFFIKYYNQIERLPLRDVNITENYTSAEREERLSSAKKIIDSGLAEFALNELLCTYSDVLDDTYIEQAETLLRKVQTEKQQTDTVPQKQETPPKQKKSKPEFKDTFDD